MDDHRLSPSHSHRLSGPAHEHLKELLETISRVVSEADWEDPRAAQSALHTAHMAAVKALEWLPE